MDARSQRIKLPNEGGKQDGSGDFRVQGNGVDQKYNLSDDNANFEQRVAEEQQIIHSVGLPMICWEQGMITAHLEDEGSDSLETLINSSPYFRELFKDKRILFLSQQVFRIFSTWLVGKQEHEIVNLDHQLSALKKLLLNCRLVCKSWCTSFDKVVQHQILNGPSGKDQSAYPLTQSEGQVNKFFQHFEKTHPPTSTTRSPLLFRQLEFVIDYHNQRNAVEIWNRMSSILQSFGDHIWHLYLHFDHIYGVMREQAYLNLREALMLAPNLKTLTISFADWNREITGAYEPLTRTHPLPKLLSLQNLEIYNMPREVFSHILRQNDHITKFRLTRFGGLNLDRNVNVKLENLNEIEFELFLPKLPVIGTKWPARKLILTLTLWPEFKLNQRLFEKVSDNWGENCEEMHLFVSWRDVGKPTFESCDNYRFNLPKVKVLFLKVGGELISVDVFLEMKSLEKITIKRNYDRHGNLLEPVEIEGMQTRIVLFGGYEKKMYESNIWHLFPELKYFEVDGIKYRRAEWIERNKMKQ